MHVRSTIMPDPDDDLSAQLKQFQDLYDQGLLSEANFRTALRGLGVNPDQIQRYVERQIIVHGNYLVQHFTPGTPPASRSTRPAVSPGARPSTHRSRRASRPTRYYGLSAWQTTMRIVRPHCVATKP
jgi:hypothetical protein